MADKKEKKDELHDKWAQDTIEITPPSDKGNTKEKQGSIIKDLKNKKKK